MPKLCSLLIAVLTASHVAPGQALPAPRSGVDDIADRWQEKVSEAGRLRGNGALDDALKSFEAALEVARSRGEESSYFGVTLSRIGSLYLDQGKHHEAAIALSRALSNLETSLGPEHMEVVGCLTDLGVCYRRMGRYAEAEGASTRVLEIVQKTGGGADVAAAQYAMGLLYSETGRQAQAVAALQTAVRLLEQQRNPPPGALAMALTSLGNVYLQQSRFHEGEPVLRRALHAAIDTYGPGAIETAHVECGLATLEAARGQSRAAEARWRRVLRILEAKRGPDHPDVGFVLLNLAETVRRPGHYVEAQSLAERGVKLMEAAFGNGAILVGEALTTLASAISSQGGYSKADPLYRRALAILLRAGDENDLRTAAALTGLAIARAKLGDYAEAEALHQRALIIEETSAPGSLLRVITLSEYAKVLRHRGQKLRAANLEKEAHAHLGRFKIASAKNTVDVSELK